jgi:glycosyltransferase involved in cell wall biosynthesis
MKILHVSARDSSGAGIAVRRLHLSLRGLGFDSTIIVEKKSSALDTVIEIRNLFVNRNKFKSNRFLLKIETFLIRVLLRNRPNGLDKLSSTLSDYKIEDLAEIKDADIIHLHWVGNIINWSSFFVSLKEKKIFWTLHDENPFCGLSHYEEEYMGLSNDKTPILRQLPFFQKLLNSIYKKKKINILREVKNVKIICPSDWILKKSIESKVLSNYEHYLIPNGVPTEIFNIKDKYIIRESLKIDRDVFYFLFVAEDLKSYRKGMLLLIEAVKILKLNPNLKFKVMTVGKINTEIKEQLFDVQFGHISDEYELANIYNAADCFVLPSLIDNLPSTMLESLCCGTPVIGFDIGGVSETIKSGINGFLSSEVSVNGLVDVMLHTINNIQTLNRKNISKKSKELYNIVLQAERYAEVYTK